MMLMHRNLRTKIPSIKSNKAVDDEKIRVQDAKAKKEAKEYADRKRRAREKDFEIGDAVLLRQQHNNKYSTPFFSDPFTIVKINGSQVIVRDKQGKMHKRNPADVKRYHEVTEESLKEAEEKDIGSPEIERSDEISLRSSIQQQPEAPSTQQSEASPQSSETLSNYTQPPRRSTRTRKPPERFAFHR